MMILSLPTARNGGAVPRNFIPHAEKGSYDCMVDGAYGYPAIGAATCVRWLPRHAVDSDEMSLKMAATLAYRKGMKKLTGSCSNLSIKLTITVPKNTWVIYGRLSNKNAAIWAWEPSIDGGKQGYHRGSTAGRIVQICHRAAPP